MWSQRIAAIVSLSWATFLTGVIRAQDVASIDPTPFLGKDWYGVYFQGEKVGFAEITRSNSKHGDIPTVVVENRITMKVLVEGNQIEMRFGERNEFAASGTQELLESRLLHSRGEGTVEWIGTRGKEAFVIRTIQGREETGRKTVPLPRENLSDVFCMEGLAAKGAKLGTKKEAFVVDLEEGTEKKGTYEVTAFEDAFAGGMKTKVVVIRDEHGKAEDSTTARFSLQGKLLEEEYSGWGKIRLEPEALAKDVRYSADLFTKGLLFPERRLGPPEKVRALTLRIRGADGAVKLPSDGRQAVRKEEDGAVLLVLNTDVAPERLKASTESDSKDALQSNTQYPCTNPEIQTLARQAVGDASTAGRKVKRLVEFVHAFIAAADWSTSMSALDVLHSRKGNCNDYAMLFITLCRAQGVPAREISGLMYPGDELGAFGGHTWAEVALDGRWVSADPTWGEFPVDATHIKQDEGDSLENSFRMLNGATQVEVVSVETTK